MTKPTPFSARHSLGEQLLSEETPNAAGLLQGGESRASASVSGIAPILLSQTVSGTAARTTIDLTFSTAMRAGTSGSIYITDGAVQTVLDSSGMPSLRIVGASDTREIALSSLHFSGEHVLIDGLDLLAGHHYSVVISPGALQSTESKAFAGVRSPGQISFSTTPVPSGDTIGPTLDAIHLDATKLKAGQDIPVTLVFSEKIATPSPAAFSTPHAELVDLHSDDGITWYATLKATAAVAAVANAFTVDMAMIRDIAGNVGRGTPPSATYDVDSLVSAWVVPHMSLMDDLGPNDDDLVTNGSTQDLVGGISGRMAAGQHLELLINGVAVVSNIIELHEFSEGSFTGYSWVYHGPVPEGINSVMARVVDDAGHSSAEYIRTVVIDNVAPAMTSTADGSTGFDPSGAVVINFSEPMYWQPSEGSDSMIEVRDGFGNTSYVAFSLAQLSTDGRTLTIPASAHHFVAGADYRITLPATLTDIAGNGVGEHNVTLHTAGTYVDTMPPRAISARVDTPSGVYSVGSVIEIHVVMNENVAMVGSAAPTLGLNNHGIATFASISGGKELVFNYVVGVGQDVPLLEVTDWTSLVNSVADLAGNKLDLSHIEFTHLENSSADMPGTSGIEIDTTKPFTMGAPMLATDSDSAAKGDNITSDDTPTLSGGGAEPGNLVYLYDGETRVATLVADDGGNWSFTPTGPLSNGTHVFSVRQEDGAGNRSDYSGALGVKIDTAANAPTLALDAASDTGTVGDNITGVPSPTIKGSAEAGALVQLSDGSTLIGTARADDSGNWSVVPSALSTGSHTLTARQTDIAGNVSPASAGLLLTVDGNAPATLSSAPALAPASDSGTVGDLVTSHNTPRVTGTGAAAGATVQLYSGSTLLGSGVADSSGNWYVDVTAALADGTYALSAKQLNAAGIAGGASPSATLKIDTAAGAPALALDAASDSAAPGDRITSVKTLAIKGGAEAFAHVEVFEGSTLVGATTADSAGNWSVTTSTLADGAHTFHAVQKDVAGNLSAASTNLLVTVDSAAPTLTSTASGSTSFDPAGAIVVNFNEAMAWKASGGNDSRIEVATGGHSTYVDFASSMLSADGRTVTLPAPALMLGSATDYTIRMPATLTDVAGNGLGSQSISLHTGGMAADTTPPSALRAEVVTPAGSYNSGSTIEIHVALSEAAAMVGSAAPTLALNNGGTASFVTLNSDNEMVFRYVVAPGQDVSMLQVTGWSSLADSVADLAGNRLDAGHITFTHLENSSAEIAGTSGIEIDTSAPATLSPPLLSSASDSGTAGDGITSDSTPTVSGSGAEPGNAVYLYDIETLVDIIYADGSGNWSYTPTEAMADRTHVFTVRQMDNAGNRSGYSPTLTVKVDTAAGAPSLALDAASDTGTIGDNITKLSAPTITGSAEAGARVELFDGGTLVGGVTADGSGNWSVTASGLTDGTHTFVAKQTDVAGNLSAASGSLQVTVDTSPPPALAAPQLAVSSDSGTVGDSITSDTTPTITGSGAVPGATIQVFNGGGTLRGTATADASGNWSFDITAVYADGGFMLGVKQLDAAGNASAMSPMATFNFDSVAAAPNITLDPGSDLDGSWDYLTKDNTPTFNGTGEAFSTVKLYVGTSEVGQATADMYGNWSITSSAVADGVISFTAVQTDRAGNVSGPGGPIPVTIDTFAAAPGAPALHPDSNSGYTTDNITSVTTPTFTGTGAEAGAKVQLYAGTDKLGETTAGADGSWSVTTKTLAEGAYSVTATQIDKAGNTSAASSAYALSIDTSAPAVAFKTSTFTSSTDTYVLKFTDQIIMGSVGDLTLLRNGTPFQTIGMGASQWSTASDSTHDFSVLTLTGLLPGAYSLQFEHTSPMNVAGLAAPGLLVGINFEIPPPTF